MRCGSLLCGGRLAFPRKRAASTAPMCGAIPHAFFPASRRGQEHDASFQCALPVPAEFGSLDHCESDSGEDRPGSLPCLLGRFRASYPTEPKGNCEASGIGAPDRHSAQSPGMSSPGRTRRIWILSSHFAVRPRVRSAPNPGTLLSPGFRQVSRRLQGQLLFYRAAHDEAITRGTKRLA